MFKVQYVQMDLSRLLLTVRTSGSVFVIAQMTPSLFLNIFTFVFICYVFHAFYQCEKTEVNRELVKQYRKMYIPSDVFLCLND